LAKANSNKMPKVYPFVYELFMKILSDVNVRFRYNLCTIMGDKLMEFIG